MGTTENTVPEFYAQDRQEWRKWLEQNHAAYSGVWLVYYRKGTGKPYVKYEDAVEEALCFGWIDSKLNKLDEERYIQLYSPRKARSQWSKPNKERVEKLIAEGLMTSAGLEKIEEAKKNGMWLQSDAVENLEIPQDLAEALKANQAAHDNFMAFSNSSKKNILWWVSRAKRPETRQKRVEETVRLAAENIRANH